MRIGGIASGIDTESIIRDMMKAHRVPLDKITQKKQYTQWQLDDYRSTNRDLRKAGDKLFDTVMKQSTYMQKTVTVSDSKVASITSKSSIGDFSGTLEVTKLAKQATLQSGELRYNSNGSKLTDADVEKKSLLNLGLFTDSDTDTDAQTLVISTPGKDGVPKTGNITVKSTDTLESVLAQITELTGVSAFYDSGTGKIAMSSKESGTGNITVISGEGGAGDLASKLRLTADATAQPGANAEFVFNGLETERTSNTFTISGFEVSLKAVTENPVTFSSSTNVDKIVDSVTQFVNDYNEMIEKLNGKISEKTYKSFHPLSDEQKADMKEKEIELWEEKAKSGTLSRDPAISTMLSNLRQVMSKGIPTGEKDANGNDITISLKDLGIETTSNYFDKGKLTINEDKLREKVAEDPDAVYKLIGRDTGDPKTSGIAHAYRAEMQDAQKKISAKAGSTTAINDSFALGRSLKSMDKQIERFEMKLQMMENRYWKQFNAMETAMQRANAQSAQLMSSLGGGM